MTRAASRLGAARRALGTGVAGPRRRILLAVALASVGLLIAVPLLVVRSGTPATGDRTGDDGVFSAQREDGGGQGGPEIGTRSSPTPATDAPGGAPEAAGGVPTGDLTGVGGDAALLGARTGDPGTAGAARGGASRGGAGDAAVPGADGPRTSAGGTTPSVAPGGSRGGEPHGTVAGGSVSSFDDDTGRSSGPEESSGYEDSRSPEESSGSEDSGGSDESGGSEDSRDPDESGGSEDSGDPDESGGSEDSGGSDDLRGSGDSTGSEDSSDREDSRGPEESSGSEESGGGDCLSQYVRDEDRDRGKRGSTRAQGRGGRLASSPGRSTTGPG